MNQPLSDAHPPAGAPFGPNVRLSGAFPLVLEAARDPFDWAAWAAANAAALRQLVHRHGALLLRGAAVAEPGQFVGFAEALCPELYTHYGDLGDAGSDSKTYAPTHYPLELPIHVHNESACNNRWPLLLFFHCLQPALEGGASRLVDGRTVLGQLPEALRRLLDQTALVYTRNHHPDLDTSWQRFYSSEDPREVEQQCLGSGVRFCWKPGQVLQTDTVRPPILPHPVSGEPVLFHQLFLFHPQSLEAETRRSLAALFPEAEFPRAIAHEGGRPVAPDTFQGLFDLYERNVVEVAMQRGDILVIDNMVVGHGRAPYRGPRRMRVAMGMMIDGRQAAAQANKQAADGVRAPRAVSAEHPVDHAANQGGALSRPMTRSVYPSVVALVDERARQSPGAVALSRGSDSWTYARLLSFARGTAQALRARGIGAGDVVAVAGEQRFETIGAMLAVWMTGGVLMPLDAATPPLRLRGQLDATRCRVVLDCGSPDLRAGAIPVVGLAELGGNPAPDFEPVPLGPDDPAYIFFTSGSTGAAKGIRGLHGGLSHFLCWQRAQFGIGAADVFAQLTRLSFDVMLRDVFTPLASGARLCLPPDESVMADPWAWLRDERITAIHVVPSLLSRWLALPGSDKACPALRLAFSAGEALDSTVVHAFRRQVSAGCRIINLYGPTETTLAKCWYEVPAVPDRGTQPLGAPLPETQIHVLDENGLPCAPGATGEIVIRTPHRSAGYLDEGDADHAGFRPNPQRDDPADLLFRSGDLGRFDAAGVLHIAGRVDDQLKIMGVRISPQEIAATLTQHATIRQAQVIGHGNEVQQLVAFVVADEALAPREGLIAFLADRLPLAMIPARYIYLEALPTTERGKVDRAALAAMASAQQQAAPAAPHAGTPLQTVTERELATLWESLLGCAPAFREANFIMLGGHSLLAVQLLSRIRQRWQADLDIRDVFRNLSLSDMARRIDQGSGKAAVPATALQPRPARLRGDAVRLPLSSTQQRLWFLAQLEPASGHYNIPGAVRFRGRLDVSVLQRCIDEIVARHEPFRTRFINAAGEPWQVVASAVELPVQRLDLQQLDTAERLAGCADAAGQAARSPFDLAVAPLLRLLLIELEADDAVLVYTFNHLIADGWTNVIFVRELCQLYAKYLEHPAAAALPSADTLQYADYALWEQQLPSDHYRKGLNHWKAVLQDAPDRLRLPTDRPRPAVQTHASDECTARLDVEQTRVLQRFCREHDVTLFIALLTFFKVALHRASGAVDLCVGTPVANRGLHALEHTYGCFINTLAIRTTLREGSTFRDYLRSVRDSVIAALAHQEVPFDRVVEAVAPARSPGHHPLFQVLLNVLHWEETPLTHPQISAHREWLVPPQSKFDMTLYVRQHHERIDLHLVYNPDLFDRSRAQGWLDDLVGLLQECLERGADRPIRGSGQTRPAEAEMRGPVHPAALPRRAWTPTERALSAIWRELLRRERFELTDNFFQLGGYSLLATRLVAVIRERMGVVVPVWKLFELPTLVELAGFIDDVTPSAAGGRETDRRADGPLRVEASALVPAQQKLWQLHAAERDGHHYNVPRAVRMLGEVRPVDLQRAVDAVVQRHPALRTLYDDSGATVIPRVLPAGDVPVRPLELGLELPDEMACIEREMTHRFDLRSEIPLRVALLRLAPAEHVLIVTTHHIAADCWSMGLPFQTLLDDDDPWHYGVFFRDLMAFYDEFTGHGAASDPHATGQHAAEWEHSRFEDIFATLQVAQGLQDWPKALGFWRNYLHGASQSIVLPTDADQPCGQFLSGRRTEFSIGRDCHARLQQFTRENRTTDFVTLFTAFARAIRLWAGADDFLVGVPVSNRGTQAAENLIGHIGNTVVLRARLEEPETPAQLARRLHREIYAALAYQYYPFDELVKELGQEEASGRSPLFQVRFVFQNMPEASGRTTGLTLRPVQFDRGVSKYDLSLVIATQGAKLRGWCEYKTPLFEPATIDAFIQRFLGELEQMLGS